MEEQNNNSNGISTVTVVVIFIIIIIIIALISFAIMGISMSGNEETTISSKSKGETTGVVITENGAKMVHSNDFEIIKSETTGSRQDDGTYIVKGKLKQNVSGSYTGIFVTITLLDKNGNKVRDTTGLQYATYAGNNIWEFCVSGNDADGTVTSYKLKSAYGY